MTNSNAYPTRFYSLASDRTLFLTYNHDLVMVFDFDQTAHD